MTPVSDPAILAQLNGAAPASAVSAAPGMQPVTDPAILAQLNGPQPTSQALGFEQGVGNFLANAAQPAIWAGKKLGFATDQLVQMLSAHPDVAAQSTVPTPSGDGGLGSAQRGIMNGLTFNMIAPADAALGATLDSLFPKSGAVSSWGQNYDAELAKERGQQAADAVTHPIMTMGGNILGGAMNPVIRALPMAKGFLGTVGQGAGVGAAYGGGTAITNQDDAGAALKDIGESAALGAFIPSVVAGAPLVARGAGNTVASALGTATGAGGRAIKGAFQAGMTGGDAAKAFTNNMRNNASMMDVVDQAKTALTDMRTQRNAQYRSGMVDVSGDKSVLDFAPIQKAADEAANIQSYKGQTIGGEADATREALDSAISNWAKLDPAEYHTPEGMDFLKKQIGEIVANTKPNTASATMAGKVYNAVKSSIQDQAPTYAKVMSDYSDASESINNIQRELNLGQRANPATALKKLQSVMRDNVNTSWGQRADYANQLDQGGTLIPSLAGQALQTVMPRGIAGPLEAAGAIGAAAFGAPHALLAAPLMSPRVMGETAYALGKGVGALGRLPLPAIRPGALTASGVAALPTFQRLP